MDHFAAERRNVEMLFARLRRILRLDRLRLRDPDGTRGDFHLSAAAHNLRKMAKIIRCRCQRLKKCADARRRRPLLSNAYFFSSIGRELSVESGAVRTSALLGSSPEASVGTRP